MPGQALGDAGATRVRYVSATSNAHHRFCVRKGKFSHRRRSECNSPDRPAQLRLLAFSITELRRRAHLSQGSQLLLQPARRDQLNF
jgi:hypothetical protein